MLKFMFSPSSITRGLVMGTTLSKTQKKRKSLNVCSFLNCSGVIYAKYLIKGRTIIRLVPNYYWVLATVALIQKQGLMWYATILSDQVETIFVKLFRRGRSGSTTRELGGLPVFLLAVTQLQCMVLGLRIDHGSGC